MTACAPSPDSIEASSVSPMLYAGQSCAASSDAAMTAVSLALFWPAMFFVGSSGDHAADIARLRGEAEAIAAAARQRGCA